MLGAVIGTVIGVVAMGSFTRSLGPLFNKINQMAFDFFPNELLPPASLVSLRHRGIISGGVYNDQMRKQGFEAGKAEELYLGGHTILNAFEAVALWRRGKLSETELSNTLTKAGWARENHKRLKQLTEAIPNVQDVIGFAVREVYSPDIAQRFGQYEGAEQVLSNARDDIDAIGMSEDTFKKFWASHWRLPSVMQGFQMLHREVINDSDLDKLLVALDIMPFWREQLKQISYRPYTRVDVRRMHKLGILSSAQVKRAYMDLGYDADKAQGMLDFTLAYNRSPTIEDETAEDRDHEQLKNVTRSTVLDAYKDGIVDADETTDLLQRLGYAQSAIEMYIAGVDYDREESVIKTQLETLHNAYVKRIYDLPTVAAKMGELNLPAKQTDLLITRWQIELEARGSKPSKAELFKFFRAGIISEQQLKSELAGYGYSDQYIDWYMQVESSKETA